MQQVKVTNRNNAWRVRDKYAAIEYVFPPGETVTIPAEAAEHIFGYGLDERARFQKFMRMGIANHPQGKKMWDNIQIRPVGNVQPTGAERVAA
jgi:hypothetical protein